MSIILSWVLVDPAWVSVLKDFPAVACCLVFCPVCASWCWLSCLPLMEDSTFPLVRLSHGFFVFYIFFITTTASAPATAFPLLWSSSTSFPHRDLFTQPLLLLLVLPLLLLSFYFSFLSLLLHPSITFFPSRSPTAPSQTPSQSQSLRCPLHLAG